MARSEPAMPDGSPVPSAPADLELHANPLVFRGVFEGTPVGINLTDVRGRVLTTNHAFGRMLGYSQAELRAKTFDSITHPDDRERDRALFHELLGGKREFYRIEKRYVRPDGRIVWVRLSVSLIRDEAGVAQFTVGVAEDITDRKAAETALRQSEARYRQLFENARDIVFTVDMDGKFTSINRAAEDVSGYTREEACAMHFTQVVAPEDAATVQQMIADMRGRRHSRTYELRLARKHGEPVLLELSTQLIVDDGRPIGVQGMGRDITTRRRAEELLRESERRFSSAFEHSPIGVALVGLDGRWLRVNRALCTLLGYSEEALVSAKFQDITHPDDLEADLELAQQLLSGEAGTCETEKRYFHQSGRLVWVRLTVSLVSHFDGTPWYFIAQVQDITEQKRAQEALRTLLQQQAASMEAMEYATTHDSLTDLVNRTLFMDRLHHSIMSARRQRTTFALILLDLDGFKSINDTYGHEAGDTCLVEVAQRLRRVVRGSDTVARLGGDEFVILLWGAGEEVARQVVAKLQTLVTKPIEMGGREVSVGVSAGVSIFPGDGNDAHTLLHHADMAMYASKRRARRLPAAWRTAPGVMQPMTSSGAARQTPI